MSWTTICALIFCAFLPFVTPKTRIEVTSDQPVLLGSNVTFRLKLYNVDQESYDVSWVELGDALYRHKVEVLNKTNGYTSNWTLWYLDEKPKEVTDDAPYLNPGTYTVG